MSSEVARLMARITTEHEAAQRAMYGIAEGTARHSFLNAHMDRVWAMKTELAEQIGEGPALTMICRVMLDESAEVSR